MNLLLYIWNVQYISAINFIIFCLFESGVLSFATVHWCSTGKRHGFLEFKMDHQKWGSAKALVDVVVNL